MSGYTTPAFGDGRQEAGQSDSAAFRELNLDRRQVLTGAALLVAGVAATPMTSASAALPVVNMGAVAAAAQAESVYGNRTIGDDASTRLVQSSLKAKGFATAVDGWYGPGTISAYAAYQRSLGYAGLAANGLPGPTSLARLGVNRFTVANKVDLGSTSDSYTGKRVSTRTRLMLAAADGQLSWGLAVTQGSYSTAVAASAGTHDGGGAADISVRGLTTTQIWQTVKALRTVGFAAWFRPALAGPRGWPAHIHAMAIGDTDMSLVGAKQVADYIVGKNGLKGNAADNTPAASRVPFTWWEKYKGL
jgi:peptidoglycan hydrolase-like protein with peptidoglycan-binding domain